MPFLMHIAFDNPFRLKGNVHYFEYGGVRFKLIQNNPRKWADVLLTIVDDAYGASAQSAYSAAGEFASALSWDFGVGATIHETYGGPGVRPAVRLRQARCVSFVFPGIPFRGMHVGHTISRIARITDEQQKIGLTLFREALTSNRVMLSLLLNWQVMEIRHGDPVGWVNKTIRRNPQILSYGPASRALTELPLGGKSLGQYLLNDCRHAIAHIRRKPGKRALRLDDEEENRRLWLSAQVTKELARHYIRSELGVVEQLHLVRPRRGGFPRYLDLATIKGGWFRSVR